MAKMRKPKWDELNRIRAEGISNPSDWKVVKRNREVMVIWNRSNGAVRELEMGGKIKPLSDSRKDMSEELARELMAHRKAETPAVAAAGESK